MTSILVVLILVAAVAAVFYYKGKRQSKPVASTSKPKTSKPKTSKPKAGGDSTQNTPNIDVQESV